MAQDAGQAIKDRLRNDLKAALRQGRAEEARLIRALVAAFDNAEAPPRETGRTATDQHRFREGSAEVERLLLGPAQVRAILETEIREREHAAAEMTRLGDQRRADALLDEVRLARRYLD